jgi:hypothetical protein
MGLEHEQTSINHAEGALPHGLVCAAQRSLSDCWRNDAWCVARVLTLLGASGQQVVDREQHIGVLDRRKALLPIVSIRGRRVYCSKIEHFYYMNCLNKLYIQLFK